MRTLPDVTPTAEQLAIFARNAAGVEVIRGAAGSGKTTTAILKLRALAALHLNRRMRTQRHEPVRALVLTFNRTLRGYVEALAEHQLSSDEDEIQLDISTFGMWARRALGSPSLVPDRSEQREIARLSRAIDLPREFLLEEVEYITGRFPPASVDDYLTARREGRGASPRVESRVRRAILDDVIRPYAEWKRAEGFMDWNDIAIALQSMRMAPPYDVIIVDEAQDFSANQIRAVTSQLADPHSMIFVVDTAQRIYPRGFTWAECGLNIRPSQVHTLSQNYRNTAEIAAFAAPLVDGLSVDPDAGIPDVAACSRHGRRPQVLRGRFSRQMEHAADFIRRHVDLDEESVAFLHPLGGGWFGHVREVLDSAGLAYVELTRRSEWPTGPENIGLSTLASAKGLEFDHVFVLGLSNETMAAAESAEEDDDERVARLRRLLAMGIGRSKQSVTVGYEPNTESRVIGILDPDTYDLINV